MSDGVALSYVIHLMDSFVVDIDITETPCLIHRPCWRWIADLDEGDSMGSLISVAANHVCAS